MQKLWGRKISDLSYYTFQQMMFYKSVRVGKVCCKIGRFEASSQICSHCGNQQKMSLDKRTYICPECGLEIDRDLNAAKNIRNFSLRNIFKNTDGTSGINACGVESSGLDDTNCLNETIDCETRKNSV